MATCPCCTTVPPLLRPPSCWPTGQAPVSVIWLEKAGGPAAPGEASSDRTTGAKRDMTVPLPDAASFHAAARPSGVTMAKRSSSVRRTREKRSGLSGRIP